IFFKPFVGGTKSPSFSIISLNASVSFWTLISIIRIFELIFSGVQPGEGVYKKSLNEQFKNFAKSTNNELARSSGLIAASIAFTSSDGNINPTNGYKNGDHHNFGRKY